jgi:hypothetical protein
VPRAAKATVFYGPKQSAFGVNASLTKNTNLPFFVKAFAQVWPNRRRHPPQQMSRLIRGDRHAQAINRAHWNQA